MADIYKRKRAKYSFEIYIGECTIPLQGSILNHGLSLLRSSFRKGYIRNSSLRIWNTAKRRGGGESLVFLPPEDRNARTPSINCTFARPILPSRIKSARFPALYLNYFPYDWPKYVYRFPSFLFRSRWKRGSSPLCILTSLRSVLPTVR